MCSLTNGHFSGWREAQHSPQRKTLASFCTFLNRFVHWPFSTPGTRAVLFLRTNAAILGLRWALGDRALKAWSGRHSQIGPAPNRRALLKWLRRQRDPALLWPLPQDSRLLALPLYLPLFSSELFHFSSFSFFFHFPSQISFTLPQLLSSFYISRCLPFFSTFSFLTSVGHFIIDKTVLLLFYQMITTL